MNRDERHDDFRTVRSFLVESYLATRNAAALAALARHAHVLEAGQAIRHLGSLVLVEDEVCFHVFEAPSAATLLAASEEAGLPCERVTKTIWAAGSGLEPT